MDKRIVVTGGASGLGREIVLAAKALGWTVTVVDRDAAAVEAIVESDRASAGRSIEGVVADLGTRDGARAAVSAIRAGGPLWGLVNNAGGQVPGVQFPDTAETNWERTLTLNLTAPMILIDGLLSLLAESRGAVVNIGSSGGVGDEPYGSPEYGAAKAGILRLSTSLGGRTDVRVTCVVPGWIGLDRAHREWRALPDAERARIGPLIPPRDVVREVVRLLATGRPGEVVEILRANPHSGADDKGARSHDYPGRDDDERSGGR